MKVQLTYAPLSINDFDSKQNERRDLFQAETTQKIAFFVKFIHKFYSINFTITIFNKYDISRLASQNFIFRYLQSIFPS